MSNIPMPGEVWFVADAEIDLISSTMRNVHENGRPVLVMMNEANCHCNNLVFNIIPLSASGRPDQFSVPVARGYKSSIDLPKGGSKAIVNHYQPIDRKHFNTQFGVLDEETYQAVLSVLKTQVLGLPDEYDTDV